MRTIEMKEIKNISKLIKKLNFNTTAENKSTLFFPITEGSTVDDGMFEMTVKNDRYGATPGLVIGRYDDSKNIEVFLAYTNIQAAPTLNLPQYIALTNSKFSKNELVEISSLECHLVKSENILAHFVI